MGFENNNDANRDPWQRPSEIMDRVGDQNGPVEKYNALVQELRDDFVKSRNNSNSSWDFRNTVLMTVHEIKRRDAQEVLAIGWLAANMDRYDRNGNGISMEEIQEGINRSEASVGTSGLTWRLDRLFLTTIMNNYESLKSAVPQRDQSGREIDAITKADVEKVIASTTRVRPLPPGDRPGTTNDGRPEGQPQRQPLTDADLAHNAQYVVNLLNGSRLAEAREAMRDTLNQLESPQRKAKFVREMDSYESQSGGKGKGHDLKVTYGANGSVQKVEIVKAQEKDYNDRAPLPYLPHVKEEQIRALEKQVTQQTEMTVRSGDSFWTLAARKLGVHPRDRSQATNIANEVNILREINPHKGVLHAGDTIQTLTSDAIRARAIDIIVEQHGQSRTNPGDTERPAPKHLGRQRLRHDFDKRR